MKPIVLTLVVLAGAFLVLPAFADDMTENEKGERAERIQKLLDEKIRLYQESKERLAESQKWLDDIIRQEEEEREAQRLFELKYPQAKPKPQPKKELSFSELSDLRKSSCRNLAEMMFDALAVHRSGLQSLVHYDKIGVMFCKWCKDLDKDEYRAACPK